MSSGVEELAALLRAERDRLTVASTNPLINKSIPGHGLENREQRNAWLAEQTAFYAKYGNPHLPLGTTSGNAKKKTQAEYRAMSDGELEDEIRGLSRYAEFSQIRRLIDSGEMKVGEFQKAIGASPVVYSRFMSQNGPNKGSNSSVYPNAAMFFKKRQLRGIKTPTKDAAPKANEPAAAATAAAVGSKVAAIELDGEKEDKVPIYDTCDEVRRKINAHLKKPGVTQAAFLRDIAAELKAVPRKIQSAQLSAFRSKKGALAGNTSIVFYAAYVYFEKMRIAEGKPKSAKREEMEVIHGPMGGVDRTRGGTYITTTKGERPYIDEYEQVCC